MVIGLRIKIQMSLQVLSLRMMFRLGWSPLLHHQLDLRLVVRLIWTPIGIGISTALLRVRFIDGISKVLVWLMVQSC